jgi:hypothetical protein
MEVERLSTSLSLWELCEGNLEGRLLFWGPWRIGRKGALVMGRLSLKRLTAEGLEKGFFTADPGYERKALGTGISLYGCSVWQPGVESSTWDFERWLKGTLEVGYLSVWEFCDGKLEGGLTCWGHWRIGRKGSGVGLLLP